MNKSRDAQSKVRTVGPFTVCNLHVRFSYKKTQKKTPYPRNIWLVLFVYTSAAGIRAVAGWTEIRKEKPRGGSRGVHDTQLFRLLTRTKRCLAREATPLLAVCQLFPPGNTLPVDSNVERNLTHMKKQSLLANLVLAGALAVAIPVFAKPMSTTLPITHNVKVGQTEVKAGDYRFVIDNNHLTVLNGKKTVAEADGRWEERASKAQYNSVVSNDEGKVIELRFEGKTGVFVIPQ